YRDTGQIQHLGVSLSPLADASRCLAHPHMEVVQLPCNAWDQRPMQRGILSAAKEGGRLCCVRSVYLQGLLTLSPEAVATRLPAAVEASRRWHAFTEQQGLSPLELAVRFGVALDVPLVVGAETPGQLRETIALVKRGPLPLESIAALAEAVAPALEDSILEPWTWPR
ncbi:MAG: hypothetical protein GWP08_04965, partial [Nitrospiraceae bacterium]|nr:hypothetical protein [Nitrospiraceae bacterium]